MIMGWNTSSVDQLAERMVFHRFRNDVFDLNGIFNQNNKDIFVDDAILGAFISSCDFTYISADQNGFPRLQVVDGGNATGIIDPVTKMLTEGYAVLKRDDSKNPIVEAYMQAIEAKSVTHNGQDSLTQIASNIEKRSIGSGGGFGFRSIKPGAEVALLDSAVLAFWAASVSKEHKKQITNC